jgi:Endonuclease/Exonuclease/phosphatase family
MRVATFNILHGRTVGDGVDPTRLLDCVRHIDPDVLSLQEVDCDQPRSDLADLTAVAAEAMGAVEHRFVAAISGTPGATWMAATGDEQPGTAAYGIALLSRFPAASWQVVRLPRIPMRFPMYLNPAAVTGNDGEVIVEDWLIQPIAADTVADVLVEAALGQIHSPRTITGPDVMRLPDLTSKLLARQGDGRRVRAVQPQLPGLAAGALLATDGARVIGPDIETWLHTLAPTGAEGSPAADESKQPVGDG